MNIRKFPDYSHWEGRVDPSIFSAIDPLFLSIKSSDNYVLPDKDGKYTWGKPYDELNHEDSRFRENFDLGRDAGMLVQAWHFGRYDRPQESKAVIVQRNLDYFKSATEGRVLKGDVPVLDLEQSDSQLEAAKLKPMDIALMSKDMVELFEEEYETEVIIYTMQYFAERYLLVNDALIEFFSKRKLWIASPKKINSNYELVWPLSKPAMPKGWPEYWAWQYTWNATFDRRSFDLNFIDATANDIAALLPSQEGAVEPPLPPIEDNHEDVADAITRMEKTISEIKTKYQLS